MGGGRSERVIEKSKAKNGKQWSELGLKTGTEASLEWRHQWSSIDWKYNLKLAKLHCQPHRPFNIVAQSI